MAHTIYSIFDPQDIAVSENTTRDHYMFRDLKSNQNYTVSVAMRNGVGEGPRATICISTTPEPTGTLLSDIVLRTSRRENISLESMCNMRHTF